MAYDGMTYMHLLGDASQYSRLYCIIKLDDYYAIAVVDFHSAALSVSS